MGFCDWLQYRHSLFGKSAKYVKYALLCLIHVAALAFNISVIIAVCRTPQMTDMLIHVNALQFVKDKTWLF